MYLRNIRLLALLLREVFVSTGFASVTHAERANTASFRLTGPACWELSCGYFIYIRLVSACPIRASIHSFSHPLVIEIHRGHGSYSSGQNSSVLKGISLCYIKTQNMMSHKLWYKIHYSFLMRLYVGLRFFAFQDTVVVFKMENLFF